MATPMTADQLVKALRDEGLKIVEHPGWRTHNRNHVGPWGPVNGVMIHHTVTSGTARSVEICRTGYSGLPGPLCHGVIDKEGVVHLIGNGRANHAGLGDDDVLRAVVNESSLPTDNETSTDGNRHFYGFECVNLGDGKDPWPVEQLEAIERASAAICRHHGWTERSVIGHKEWQPGKIDPRGFEMDDMRTRIAGRLSAQKPTPAPAPAKPPVKATAPKYEPYPGTEFFMHGGRPALGKSSKVFTAMGKRLVAEGCGLYKVGPGPVLGEADVRSYEKWQRKLGYTGADAKWPPGPTSWDKLKIPNV